MFYNLPKGIISFIALLGLSAIATYYMPGIITSLWYIILLLLYYKTKDEVLWFALFFVLSDGIMGFFGNFGAVISIIPGLPEIELVQAYLLIAIFKNIYKFNAYPIFYKNWLLLMGSYIVFLIIWGLIIGLTGGLNIYFRVFRLILPFLFFYLIPKIIKSEEDYIRLFSFLFPITILGLFAQIFDIALGQTFTSFIGARPYTAFELDVRIYRGLYSPHILLLSLFAALYLQTKKSAPLNSIYLYAVIISSVFSAFLSATRGWMTAFSAIIILYFVLNLTVKPGRIFVFLIIIGSFILGVTKIPIVRLQMIGSIERFSTVKDMAEGDAKALDTDIRSSIRSPIVMSKWRENKIFGWGFSDTFFLSRDGHVGNQNILLHSGILGALLIAGFFLKFFIALGLQAFYPYKSRDNLVFLIFFMGWFFIHSTSGQHFGLSISPSVAMMQATFFSFGAFVYNHVRIQLFERSQR